MANYVSNFVDSVINFVSNGTQYYQNPASNNFEQFMKSMSAVLSSVVNSTYIQVNQTFTCPLAQHANIQKLMATFRAAVSTCGNNTLNRLQASQNSNLSDSMSKNLNNTSTALNNCMVSFLVNPLNGLDCVFYVRNLLDTVWFLNLVIFWLSQV
jgi:hypothetical protein